jgi:hypothetical protein
MKKTARWAFLALLTLAAVAAWLISGPQFASSPIGPVHAAVDCRDGGCGAGSQNRTSTTPIYPAPQVDDALPPAEPPPTF